MARKTHALAIPKGSFLSQLPAVQISETEAIDRIFAAWNAQASPHTVAARILDLLSFGKSMMGMSDPRLIAMRFLGAGPMLARELALGWDREANDAGLADTTRARRLTTLRSLVNQAGEFGLPWTLRIKSPHVVEYGRAQGPTPEAVEDAIAELTKAERWRDLSLILLCFDLALRTSEAIAICVEDVNWAQRTVKVTRKGGLVVARKMSKRCAVALRQAIKLLVDVTEGPIFPPRRNIDTGDHMSRMSAYRLGHELGLGGLHGLRHAAGTLALERTHGDVVKVKHFLGHARVATTQVYMDRQNAERDAGDVTGMIAGED